jgi:cell division protein FtsZ
MTLNLTVSKDLPIDFTPKISVIGVGGGGTNAVNNMIAMDLQGVEFIVANTDAQSLVNSRASRRIQLGPHITQGLGAGAKPEIGQAAAEEAADELYDALEGAHMVFITAGMGGGTGTGAAPVIARMARERGILTVGVVTKPFTFEGSRRAKAAEQGIAELIPHVDTLIVIPNQNLYRMANERTGYKEAFKMVDNVLYMGVRGVTDLITVPGEINLDFADIRTVMREMGKAMMGTGEADGENRAIRAAEAAINNPLLENTSMAGASGLLINITGGDDLTLFEVGEAADRIREEVDEGANIIFGTATDHNLAGRIRISVVATGIDTAVPRGEQKPQLQVVNGGPIMQDAPESVAPAPATPTQTSATNVRPATGYNPAGFNNPNRPPMPPPIPQNGLRTPSGNTAPATGLRQQSEPAAQPRQHDYPTISDDMPAKPRAIPPHLQQPVGQPKPAPSRQSVLFNPPEPVAQPAAQPQRRSLFSMVTGKIRGGLPQAAPHAPVTAPPVTAPLAHQVAHPGTYAAEPQEPIAEAPRQGNPDDVEIPTFLRRQLS